MKIKDLLQQVKDQLGPQGDNLGAEVLLAFVLKKDRSYLVAHPQSELNESEYQQFTALFDCFIDGRPVAYLTNCKEFYGLDFYVDGRVLIPRPETEMLVEKVIEYSKQPFASKVLRILDIGTGSGCIAVSLAKHIRNVQILATDISADALEVAKMNAIRHGVQAQVFFQKSDLLDAVKGEFDIIVANLPYIGEKRFRFVAREAFDYEPHVALFGGDDGLQLYDKLFRQLLLLDWKPSLLLGEFGFLQRDELEKVLREKIGYAQYRIFQDYAHIDRMFVVEFPPVALI